MKSREVIAGAAGLIGSNLAGQVVAGMTKSRLAGFHEYQPALGSFLDYFARPWSGKIIPA